MTTADLLCAARAVKPAAAALSTAEKNRLLEAMAQALLDHADNILAANAADVEAARGVIAPVMIDRLSLSPAGPEDFDTEFLDYILAVKVVDSVQDAAAHIVAHSTGHSEAIVTEDAAAADAFCAAVDSAAVYVNASTRFTDGGEFGLGCEMGISTQKLGARGPMGLAELTSYKYIIRGNGQVR